MYIYTYLLLTKTDQCFGENDAPSVNQLFTRTLVDNTSTAPADTQGQATHRAMFFMMNHKSKNFHQAMQICATC